MKILTVNFLTCAVKACKTSPLSFPLHFRDAELEQSDIEYNSSFLCNVLPRIDWEALKVTANELGFTTVPNEKPTISPPPVDPSHPVSAVDTTSESEGFSEKVMRDLHTLLLETEVREGKMVCGNCGHAYRIKEGIANFLLPSHLV
ncbi:adoMet-dependent tRNA methyltransferase complex subunit Trm112 [Usnea florida]